MYLSSSNGVVSSMNGLVTNAYVTVDTPSFTPSEILLNSSSTSSLSFNSTFYGLSTNADTVITGTNPTITILGLTDICGNNSLTANE